MKIANLRISIITCLKIEMINRLIFIFVLPCDTLSCMFVINTQLTSDVASGVTIVKSLVLETSSNL